LVKELDANVSKAGHDGSTPLHIAAERGNLNVIRALVKHLGADVNTSDEQGRTPLMSASYGKQEKGIRWLIKNGANTQAVHQGTNVTAMDYSRASNAPAEQTAYLEAIANCASPDCEGAGLKKCSGYLQVFFCGPACIHAYWPAHKAECRRRSAEAKESEDK
jgi:ankyrin repeat protein